MGRRGTLRDRRAVQLVSAPILARTEGFDLSAARAAENADRSFPDDVRAYGLRHLVAGA
jgi:hypothetical protein